MVATRNAPPRTGWAARTRQVQSEKRQTAHAYGESKTPAQAPQKKQAGNGREPRERRLVDAEELAAATDRDCQTTEARIAEVYAREHGRLAALGTMLTDDAAAGEDLAHDVFLHALRRCREDPEYLRDPTWPWLQLTLVRRSMRRSERITDELQRLTLLHHSTPPAT